MARTTTWTSPTVALDENHARPLRRSRQLPNGRAVAGGLLVATATVGSFAAYTRAATGPQHAYLVIRDSVRLGGRLTPADLALVRMDLPTSLREQAFDDPASVVGTVLVAPLAAGELLQRSDVVRRVGGASNSEVTFAVERTHASGAIQSGERVDVYGTFGSGRDSITREIVRQALVVVFSANRSSLNDPTDLMTVALGTQSDVLALIDAVQNARLTIVRPPATDTSAGSVSNAAS